MAHKTQQFERLVQEKMEEWKVPGLSLAIIQGEDIYTKVIGSQASKVTSHSLTRTVLRLCDTSGQLD
jgi:CubicO group peptidase (beta-lactamase class C family)